MPSIQSARRHARAKRGTVFVTGPLRALSSKFLCPPCAAELHADPPAPTSVLDAERVDGRGAACSECGLPLIESDGSPAFDVGEADDAE